MNHVLGIGQIIQAGTTTYKVTSITKAAVTLHVMRKDGTLAQGRPRDTTLTRTLDEMELWIGAKTS